MLKKPTGGKKTAAKKKAKPVTITERIQAPYKFSPNEIADMSATMRRHMTDSDALRDQAKQAAQDFKLRISTHENEVKSLRAKCDSGEETRPVDAIVKFNPTKRTKTFFWPGKDGAEIRTESMTLADFQLPMFKPDESGKETPAPKGATDVTSDAPKAEKAKTKKAKPAGEAGKTSVGAALNAAAGGTDAPKLDLYMDEIEDESKLVGAFKKAAKAAGWSQAQIGVLNDALKDCESVSAMKDVLRPHIVDHPTELK